MITKDSQNNSQQFRPNKALESYKFTVILKVKQTLQKVDLCGFESDTPSSKKVVQFKETCQYSDFCKYRRVAGSYPL